MKNLLSQQDLKNLLREIEERVRAEGDKRAAEATAAAVAEGKRPPTLDEQLQEEDAIRKKVATPHEIALIRDTLADLKEKLAAAQARAASNTSEDGDDTTTGDETKELEDLHARIADFEAAQDRYATYFAR